MTHDNKAENDEKPKMNREINEVREGRVDKDVAYQQERRFENARNFTEPNKEIKEAREKKSEIIEQMVTKDFPVTPEKRLDNAKDFHYADEKEFARELKKRDPFSAEMEIKLTEGFHYTPDKQAFVKEHGDTLVTSIHEKLHQKSMSELPTRLNEGVTEYLARKEAGVWGKLKDIDAQGREIPKIPSDYENEVEIVGKLEATVGKEPLHAAYFEGKTEVLKHHVDGILGDGSFQKISNSLENRDYKTANQIIEKYYKK